MITLELTRHPDWSAAAEELRHGHAVVIAEHAHEITRISPAAPAGAALLASARAFRQRMPIRLAGNAVLDMRAEDER